MRQSILLIFLLLCVGVTFGQSQKSKKLFSQGIELYNQQKYKEAIKMFNRCKELDEIEMDSLDFRKEYSKEWIAHCYYKLNDINNAKAQEGVYDYDREPVDRALIADADSLLYLANTIASNGNIAYAINKCREGLELAEAALGKNHYAVANIRAGLGSYYIFNNNFDKADAEFQLAKQIYKSLGYETCYDYGQTLLYEAALNMQRGNLSAAMQLAEEANGIFKKWDNAGYSQLINVYYCMAYCTSVDVFKQESEPYILLLAEELKRIQPSEVYNYEPQITLCCSGLIYFNRYDEALDLLNVSMDFVKRQTWLNGDNQLYISLLTLRANILLEFNQYDKALADVTTIITTCENTMFFDKNLLDEYYVFLANLYSCKNDPLHQLEAAKKAYRLASARRDDRALVKANAKSFMAGANHVLENNKEALDDIQETIALLEQSGLKDSGNYANALSLKAEIEMSDNPIMAIEDTKNSISIYERQPAPTINFIGLFNAKSRLFQLYRQALMEKEASGLLDDMEQMSQDASIPNSTREHILIKLFGAKGDMSSLENVPKAIDYYKQAIGLARKYDGYETSQLEMNLAQSYSRNADMDKATSMIDSLLVALDGDANRRLQYANALVAASFIYGSKGDVQKTRDYQNRSLQLFGELYGKRSLKFSSALASAAYQLAQLGLPVDAYPLIKEAEKIALTHLKPDDADMATLYTCLQTVESAVGNISKAIEYGEKAKALAENYAPPIALCEVLCSLSNCYKENAQFNEALTLLNEALAIVDNANERRTMRGAQVFWNLANVYQAMGNYMEARVNQGVYCEIVKKLVDKTHPLYGMTLLFDARQKYESGDTDSALNIAKEAVSVFENSLGETNPITLEVRAVVTQIAMQQGNLADAISELEAINELQLQNKCPNLSIMEFLAGCYGTAGNFKLQNSIAEKMLDYSRKKYGKESTQAGNAYLQMANSWYGLGNIGKCAEYSNKVFDIYRKTLLGNFLFMTKNERANLWAGASNFFMSTIPGACTLTEDHEVFSPLAYNAALLSKGLLLQAETNVSDLIYKAGSQSIKDEYNHFVSTKNMYNKATASFTEDAEVDEIIRMMQMIDSLAEDIDKREHVLMQHVSDEFGDYTSRLATTWTDVRSALGSADMAIEFLNVAVAPDSIRYYALVVTKETKKPVYIDMPSNTVLNKYHDYKKVSESELKELSVRLWEPIMSRFPNKKNIYFSPAGDLYNIPIESLPSSDGNSYLSDVYNFYRLSSTRELTAQYVKWQQDAISLYGDVKYDASTNAMRENFEKYNGNISRSTSYVDFLDDDEGDKNRGLLILTSLHGTKAEVDSIASIVRVSGSMALPHPPYVGLEASESSVKALSGQGERVLHIATHGFYFPYNKVRDSKFLQSLFSNVYNGKGFDTYETIEDAALLRCGLFLAGAKNRLESKEYPLIDDGILTAHEISMLNFNGLDLVVLSACETGIGDVTGEGVFGLQRGFKKAGTHSILMSLWKVDDEATSFLMKEFYKKWLSGASKQQSLEYAKAQVRNHPNWSSPWYWSAFVLLDGIGKN